MSLVAQFVPDSPLVFQCSPSRRERSPRRERERSPHDRTSDRRTTEYRSTERSGSPTQAAKRARYDLDNPNPRPQPFIHFQRTPYGNASLLPSPQMVPMMYGQAAMSQAAPTASISADPLTPLPFRNWVATQDERYNSAKRVSC